MNSRAALAALPNHELHVHLQGALPVEFLLRQFNFYPPEQAVSGAPERLRGLYLNHPSIQAVLAIADKNLAIQKLLAIYSFPEFLRAYIFSLLFVRREEDLLRLILAVAASYQEQGITYAEFTVAPYEYTLYGMSYREILRALRTGQERAVGEFGLQIVWIFDPIRTFGADKAEALFETVMAEHSSTFAAITIGGDEQAAATKNFKRLYHSAAKHGLKLTAHAGELCGAVSVWQAIDDLGVTRVGHGIRAIEDSVLVKTLVQRSIPLEVCISSNLVTRVVKSLKKHPVRELFEAGVRITINSDDPTFFKTNLAREFELLTDLGFSAEEQQRVRENNREFAFAELIRAARAE